MPSLNWAPNPYAIAQRLNGQQDIKRLSEASGKDADDFLRKAFKLEEKRRTFSQAMKPFRELAAKVAQPMLIEELLALDWFKDHGYDEPQIRRVLPLLVQVADASFGSASPSHSPMPVLASFGNAQDLIVDGMAYLDPVQGDTADCYLISSMIGLAWADPNRLRAKVDAPEFAAGSFRWQFHDRQSSTLPPVSVSKLVPRDGDFPLFARSSEPSEFWPGLLEKAYVVKMANDRRHSLLNGEPTPANYQSISNFELPQDACRALVGGTTQPEILNTPSGEQIFSFSENRQLRGKLATEAGIVDRPVMAWTELNPGNDSLSWEDTGLFANHAYAVLGVIQSGPVVEHVVLRNPYGYATDETRPGYKSGIWVPGGRQPVELNKNGVFAISRELFYQCFKNIGWVDL